MKKLILILMIGNLLAETYTISRLRANSNYWQHIESSNNIVYKIDFGEMNISLNLVAGLSPEDVEISHHKGQTSAYICFIKNDIECVTADIYYKTPMKKVIPLDSEIIDKYGEEITRDTYGDWLLQLCDNKCLDSRLGNNLFLMYSPEKKEEK